MTDPAQNLKKYLVGGAVRDALLNLPSSDKDWVVVGETPSSMEKLGFRPVGKDFPVFLHPLTQEEYALARTERKSGPGYRGFEFTYDNSITLEQDLYRRDLTINAIAMDGEGNIIDPYDGQKDLRDKKLRHVSDAFSEDPVRVLRVARFAAQYVDKGFKVSKDTVELMRKMVQSGEVDFLVAERVWQECQKALMAPRPSEFIQVLRNCNALIKIFPEIDSLFGVPQTKKYHPEIDTGIHTMMALDIASGLTANPRVRFAVLVHDLGKALTPVDELPSHRGHESRGVIPVHKVCDRLKVSAKYRDLAVKVCRFHLLSHRLMELKPNTILRLLEDLDAFRKPENLIEFSLACEADYRGRLGLQERNYIQKTQLNEYYESALSVNTKEIATRLKDGKAIQDAIKQARTKAIKGYQSEVSDRRI